MILLFARKSLEQALTMYQSLVNTCSIFKSTVEKGRIEILPRIHLKCIEKLLRKLSRQSNKIEISVRKILKYFDQSSGIPNLLISLYLERIAGQLTC